MYILRLIFKVVSRHQVEKRRVFRLCRRW